MGSTPIFVSVSEYSAVGSASVLGTGGHAFKSHYSDKKEVIIMISLHFCLCILLLVCSIMVLIAINPVHSVLYLICTFILASISILLHEVEFLGLLFLIIYVGAIAILFLFVVMMLTVKLSANTSSTVLRVFTIIPIFTFTFIFFLFKNFIGDSSILIESDFLFSSMDYSDMLFVFGQALFNYNLILFLIAGLILLIAVIGAVVLTLEHKSDKHHVIAFRQLSRSRGTVENRS